MKNKVILTTLLLTSVACNKATDTAVDTPYTLTTSFEDRTYDFSEQIECTLKVEARAAADDHFMLTVSSSGGPSTLTVDDEALAYNELREIQYETIDDARSTRVLHFTVTPAASSSATQTMTLLFGVSSPDGKYTATYPVGISMTNQADISATADYDPRPVDIRHGLDFTLLAEKRLYCGEFVVTPCIEQGDGFIVFGGENYPDDRPFRIVASEAAALRYQPLTWGPQKVVLTISDGVSTQDVSIETTVMDK